MGTSRPTKGPSPSTPIVPTWSDDSDKGPIPGGDGPQPDTTEDDPSADDGQHQPEPAPRAPIKPPVLPDRFRTARSNFTRSAGSGGQDRDAMRRGIRDYVRNGTGGSGGATRRMGSARSAAAGVLGVLRSIQTDGVEATLSKFNLGDLAGQPIDQIFAGLTDVICEPGGNINDSIATDAWIETITELDQLGVDDLDSLSSEFSSLSSRTLLRRASIKTSAQKVSSRAKTRMPSEPSKRSSRIISSAPLAIPFRLM